MIMIVTSTNTATKYSKDVHNLLNDIKYDSNIFTPKEINASCD